MSHVAFLLVSLDGNTPARVAREVRGIAGVSEAHATMGDYDVIAVLRAEHTRDIPRIIAEIRGVHGVIKIVSCVVVDSG
jgi:DNA-binding Lrp family transcriptional regulator